MNRIKIELVFLVGLIILTILLSQTVSLYKTEYIGLDWNPWYTCALIVIWLAFLLFNHTVMRMNFSVNLMYSLITGTLFLWTSVKMVRLFVAYLEKIDQQVTPLGWQFKYQWLELIILGFLLVLGTETLGKRLQKRAK